MTPDKMRRVNIAVMSQSASLFALQAATLRAVGVRNVMRITNVRALQAAFTHYRFDLLVINDAYDLDLSETMACVRNRKTFGYPYVISLLMTSSTTTQKIRDATNMGFDGVAKIPFTAESFLTRIWQLSVQERRFVNVGDYFGPDRRRVDVGPPSGMAGRRLTDGGERQKTA